MFIFRMANFIVVLLRLKKWKLNLLSSKMMKEKLIVNLNRLIKRLKNFPQILNRSHPLIFRKIQLILVRGLLQMIEERREGTIKVEIKKIEDKIIREMIEKEGQRRARRSKEVFKRILNKIKDKDVRRDQEKNKTPHKNLRKLKNKSVNTMRKKRELNKKESSGWKNIKKIDRIKKIKRNLKILNLKSKIKNKEIVVHKEEMMNRENGTKEEREDLHVMMKTMMTKNYQEVLKELKRKNLILPLNN